MAQIPSLPAVIDGAFGAGNRRARKAALAEAPDGQLTWAVHVSLAPTWFDPAETPGMITPFMLLYALHDAMVKPMPGKPPSRAWRKSWTMRRTASATSSPCAQGAKFHNGDAGDRGGREVLLRALSRHLGAADEGAGGRRRDARRAHRALRAQEAVARLPDLLHLGQRRRLDRAQEIRPEGRRGGLQEGADRRRPLQVRLLHAGRRAGARGVRRLLAQDADREAAGLQGDPRGVDAAGGAQARRGRYRLLDPRRAGRGAAEDAGADPEAGGDPGHRSGSTSPTSGTPNRRGTTSACARRRGWRSTTSRSPRR